jgi:hypothetical protein
LIIFVSSECRVVVVVQIQVLFLVVTSTTSSWLRDTSRLVVAADVNVVLSVFTRLTCSCGGAGSVISATATAASTETTTTATATSVAGFANEVLFKMLFDLFLFVEFTGQKFFFLLLKSLFALIGVESEFTDTIPDLKYTEAITSNKDYYNNITTIELTLTGEFTSAFASSSSD